ncbi:hypothetical protein SYJ56_23930 [Algoriphagus sp. D3-2-R+10]|uniref:hypothetical protein n=1 Tax=Algoriphagus aurantiacus TaxID=3103948 RepID=UPI002B372135|nr:hypothetical protein [Algoriphagus sp. D3-2-R+10]MEB2778380.1 hypothetical protein [Algoriphagus sp. D3-2-R+10]
MKKAKKLLLSLSCSLLLQNVFAQQEKEEMLRLECMNSTFAKNDIDLAVKLDSIEDYLILTGQLYDSSGEGYFDFFQLAGNAPDHFTILPKEMILPFLTISPKDFYQTSCRQDFNFVDSTFLANKLEAHLQKIQIDDRGFETNQIAQGLTQILSAKDFDRPYYRTLSLLSIVYGSLEETPATLNSLLQQNKLGAPCPFLQIELTSTNHWLWGKKEIGQNELYKLIENAFWEDPTLFCLKINASKNSPIPLTEIFMRN